MDDQATFDKEEFVTRLRLAEIPEHEARKWAEVLDEAHMAPDLASRIAALEITTRSELLAVAAALRVDFMSLERRLLIHVAAGAWFVIIAVGLMIKFWI